MTRSKVFLIYAVALSIALSLVTALSVVSMSGVIWVFLAIGLILLLIMG